jgi:hypothetical protein
MTNSYSLFPEKAGRKFGQQSMKGMGDRVKGGSKLLFSSQSAELSGTTTFRP